MLCGPLSSNAKLHLVMPRPLHVDATTMYSSWETSRGEQQGFRFASEVGDKSASTRREEFGLPVALSFPGNINSDTSRDVQFRILPKRFSTLGEIGVIKERDACDRLGAFALEQREAATSAKTSTSAKQPGSQQRRARTEVAFFLYSQRSALKSNTDDKRVVDERSTEEVASPRFLRGEFKPCTPVSCIENVSKLRRASVQHIVSLVNPQINTKRVNKVRKMSLPNNSSVLMVSHGRSSSLDSGLKTRDTRYIEDANLDTELQWERLVARARGFQTLGSSPIPERAFSKLDRREKEARKSDYMVKIHPVAEDEELSEDDSEISDICSEASHTSSGSSASSTTCHGETFALIAKPRRASTESQGEKELTEDTEMTESTQEHDDTDIKETVGVVESNPTVKDNGPVADTSVSSHRRFSLATLRPQTENVERMSGYSTHGALEYAKKLLGKIQTEGETKTKKERLNDTSKALKLVLGELNRIERPDRELVSLFISLRAKIVNLKAQLKNGEEGDCSEDERAGISQTLPAQTAGEGNLSRTHVRRYSWC